MNADTNIRQSSHYNNIVMEKDTSTSHNGSTAMLLVTEHEDCCVLRTKRLCRHHEKDDADASSRSSPVHHDKRDAPFLPYPSNHHVAPVSHSDRTRTQSSSPCTSTNSSTFFPFTSRSNSTTPARRTSRLGQHKRGAVHSESAFATDNDPFNHHLHYCQLDDSPVITDPLAHDDPTADNEFSGISTPYCNREGVEFPFPFPCPPPLRTLTTTPVVLKRADIIRTLGGKRTLAAIDADDSSLGRKVRHTNHSRSRHPNHEFFPYSGGNCSIGDDVYATNDSKYHFLHEPIPVGVSDQHRWNSHSPSYYYYYHGHQGNTHPNTSHREERSLNIQPLRVPTDPRPFPPIPAASFSSSGLLLAPHSENILSSSSSCRIGSSQVLPYYNRHVLPLSTDDDGQWLSDFLCFVRSECVEVFSASSHDVASRTNSKRVVLDQAGIRCRFCAHLPHRDRAGRSSSFPSLTSRIYQSLTMMLRDHFISCRAMPPHIQHKHHNLKANVSHGATGSKRYWITSAHDLGLTDTAGKGMRLRVARGSSEE